MPCFYELYGDEPYTSDPESVRVRKNAVCPFTEQECDGGGNRHQTKIRLAGSALENYFSPDLAKVVPGVCSIEQSDSVWIVCPRRLLGFVAPDKGIPVTNYSLKQHERDALIQAGLPRNIDLGVWAEVYLKYQEDETSINYHFDFVIDAISRNCTFSRILNDNSIVDEDDAKEFISSARKGGYITGVYSPTKEYPVLPNITSPTIIEVMTASTSGSDTEAGTNIASAFTNALLGNTHNCPGINKRQVWGRMATQLFAKSALAKHWGGKTVWLVQDRLLHNIELTTKLNITQPQLASDETINFLSMRYNAGERGVDSVVVGDYAEIASGLNYEGNSEATDILLPKVEPHRNELLKSILRRKLSAIIRL